MKSIFAFVGSKKGEKSNTFIVISRILEILKSKTQEDLSIEIATSRSYEIKPCIGCGHCFMASNCSIEQYDMMHALKEKMKNADMLIIGSGVYLHNISSDCKNFLDRIGIWTHTFELAGKATITITTSASNGNEIVNGYLQKIFQCMGAKIVANIGIRLLGNDSLVYPDEQMLSEYADIIGKELHNSELIKVSNQQEQFFQNMKEIIKHNSKLYDAKVWRENGYFNCNNFSDLIERKKMEITRNEVKEYWYSELFPEFGSKRENELNMHFERTLGKSIDRLSEEYIENSIKKEQDFIVSYNEFFYTSQVKKNIPLYRFFAPLINDDLTMFYEHISGNNFIAAKKIFYEDVVIDLLTSLSKKATRTLILVLNIAREEGKLVGSTSEERYKYFINVFLGEPENLLQLYNTYPVLVDLIKKTSNDYFDYLKEILASWEQDCNRLNTYFDLNAEKIVSIKLGMGDWHAGKSVARITFDNGISLIFKPRNAQVEAKFNELVQMLNSNKFVDMLDLRYAKVFTQSHYAWVENIEYKKCSSICEVERYYVRAGQLLALLHIMNAVDFHYENIIAEGEYPVPIDLETIMHPIDRSYDYLFENEFVRAANEELDRAVINIGLLPHNVGDAGSDRVLDIGGISCEAKRVSPFAGAVIENMGKDTMSLSYSFCELDSGINSPAEKSNMGPEFFIKEIKEGFVNCYRWILFNKDLIEKKIDEFSGVNIRVLFRATYKYTRLLDTSTHPDFLSNYSNYEAVLSRVGIKDIGIYQRIEKSEIAQIKDHYIPYFIANTDGTDIKDALGNTMNNVLKESPIEKVRKKMSTIGLKDLERQLKYIDMAFTSTGINRKKDVTNFKFSLFNVQNTNPLKWLDLARKIGDYLIENAITYKGKDIGMTWVSCILLGKNEGLTDIAPVGLDLYNGNSGISIYFTYLWHFTHEEKYLTAAIQACEPLCSYLDNIREEQVDAIGMYSGLAGQLLALYTLYKMTGYDYSKYIRKYLQIIEMKIENTNNNDVVAGISGAIIVLLYILKDANLIEYKLWIEEIIKKGVLQLEKTVILKDVNKGWINSGNRFYTGFAHGNAGIISSILLANNFGCGRKLSNIINSLLEWERSMYSSAGENWFIDSKKERLGFGWCHGAPGILLCKSILLHSDYKDTLIENEFQRALDITIENCFGSNPSLCHGDLGNLQILHFVAKHQRNGTLEKQCLSNFNTYVEHILSNRWKGAAFRGTESVGMMIGVTGFGYSLLRFCDAEIVPMILCPII